MRKEKRLILAGLVAFDLGTVVVPVQAADGIFIKMQDTSEDANYTKIGSLASTDACVASKGKLVEIKGEKYCQTPKAAAGPAPAIPSNQRR